MESTLHINTYPFLKGGGEMGALTRAYDWATSPLGLPETWPQSLRTTLSIVLNSKFPMFLFWGPKKICFYNDAYRPSLGNDGKHPFALGKPGEEIWPEIWDTIAPQIDNVLAGGEASWQEDQYLPIYRNGGLEDVYWTYSYSPVEDETGQPAGVFVTCSETTNKVQTLQRLLQSENRFYTLVLEATMGIAVLMGEDCKLEIANDAFVQLLHRPGLDGIGKPFFDLVPEARPLFQPIVEKVRLTGESVHLLDQPYFTVASGQRQEGFLNITYKPFRETGSMVSGVMLLCQDVTEGVLSRKRLEEAEERVRLSVQAAGLGIYAVDLTTNEVEASPQFSALFGVPPGAPRDQFVNAFLPEDLAIRRAAYERAYKDGQLEYEGRVQWPDRSIHWVRIKGKVYFDAANKPVRQLGVAQDITEEKAFYTELERQVRLRTEELVEAQGSLVAANDYLQLIINKFESAMCVLSPVWEDGRIVDFRFEMSNTAYSAYSGQEPATLTGKNVTAVFPNYQKTEAFAQYVGVYHTGEPKTWELHYDMDGLDVHLLVTVSKIGDEVSVQFSDITELKNLQLNLEHKVEELQRSNTNLEEFAHAASHDLKEPIRKIHTFSERLKTSLEDKMSEGDQRLFERMESAATRMNSLIDDLLSYSQVSQKGAEIHAVDLNKKITMVLTDLDMVIEDKSAVVETGELPTVQGFPRQVQQLFQNLIGNALKYSRADVPPKITISATTVTGAEAGRPLPPEMSARSFYKVQVADNGIGFEQKDAERIFNMFQRLHGRSEYSGTGIGLAIVQKVMENHHGYIWADAQPGEGAVFTLLFPAEMPRL